MLVALSPFAASRLSAAGPFTAPWETGALGERFLCWESNAWHRYSIRTTTDIVNRTTIGAYFAPRSGEVHWRALTIDDPTD